MKAKIAAALRPLAVDIESIQPYPDNPRQGDVGAIVASLRRFGQQKPLVVQDSTGYIVAGNHLWRAARELKWEQVAVNRTDLSDVEARAYLVADNRMSDLGTYDDDALAEIVRRIGEEGSLRGTGFDGDDLDALLRTVANDQILDEWVGMPEFTSEDQRGWKALVVHFANEQDYHRFADQVQQPLTEKTRSIWYPERKRSAEIGHARYAPGES